MAQITYADKTALYENQDIQPENKVRDVDMNEIKEVVNDNETKILLAVSSSAPAECSTGDMYFNTTDNLIYTATATDTWSSTGVAPTENTIYVVIDTQTSYIYDGTTLVSVGGGSGSGGGENIPIGTISAFAGNTAPTGYLMCDGSAVSRTTYSELFTAIGTIYGAGDGSTTFNLPNIKGRTIVMQDTNDNDFDTLGETGGEKTHTLTTNEMPSHSHGIGYASTGAGGNAAAIMSYVPSATFASNSTGGGQAHNNLQPYIVLNYIIKATMTTGTTSEVVNEYSDSQTDTYSCDYLNGKLLWTNPSPTSDFAAQDININISSYDCIKIIYNYSVGSPFELNTGEIPSSSAGTVLSMLYNSSGINFFTSRIVNFASNKLTFANAIDSNGNSTNNHLVPLYVIGYKSGLFN